MAEGPNEKNRPLFKPLVGQHTIIHTYTYVHLAVRYLRVTAIYTFYAKPLTFFPLLILFYSITSRAHNKILSIPRASAVNNMHDICIVCVRVRITGAKKRKIPLYLTSYETFKYL